VTLRHHGLWLNRHVIETKEIASLNNAPNCGTSLLESRDHGGEESMRDIRNDLLERVDLMEGRIKAAHAKCEDKIKQLQSERDATVADLKSSIAMLAKLLEFEQQETGNVPPVAPKSPQLSLADFFERKLIESGPLSKDDLCNMAMKEGYFPDAESARQTVDGTLMNIVREKRICPLPDGTYALPMLSQAVRLRRVV
jgi:hypothetical protein